MSEKRKHFRMFSPGDLIVNSPTQQWRVSGSYSGALNQQSLVGVEPLHASYGTAHGKDVIEALVPEEFLYKLCEAGLLTHFTQYESPEVSR